MSEVRGKAVELDPRIMVEFLQGKKRIIGLPDGAVCLEAFDDPWTKNMIFIVDHESFAPKPNGAQFEVMKVEVVDT